MCRPCAGIDIRPATGQIFGISATNRTIILNGTSGAVTYVGNPLNPASSGSAFGFDFNPTVDRIRLTSDARQDLRLNPNNGAVAATDGVIVTATGLPTIGLAGVTADSVTVGAVTTLTVNSPFCAPTVAVTLVTRLVVSVVAALPLPSVNTFELPRVP